MSLAATFVSSTSFSTAGDKTAEFCPGRSVRCDCGTDGIRYGYVDYSSYAAPNTTVSLINAESMALTANLTAVEFSAIKPDSANAGNISLETLLQVRGHKRGMIVSYKDSDEIYVGAGSLHIADGTERLYIVPSQITKQLTGLSASTWYAVYAKPPVSGLVLTASEIEYSTTIPAWSESKQGWYHSGNTSWRCISFVRIDDAGAVQPFVHANGSWTVTGGYIARDVNAQAPSNVWTTYALTLPIGGVRAIMVIEANYVNANTNMWYRKDASAYSVNSDHYFVVYISSINGTLKSQWMLPVTATKTVDYRWGSATANTFSVFTVGFVLPEGM